jgi:hypothetical protein
MVEQNQNMNQVEGRRMTPPPMPPQGQLMGPARPRGWRERWMQRFGMDVAAAPLRKGERTIPNWLTGKAMVFFFVAMFVCWGAFGYVPSFDLWFTAVISILLFFYGGSVMSKSWQHTQERAFLKNIFISGLLIRFLWILYCYYVFNPEYYGNTYGETADVDWYMPFGKEIAQWISSGFNESFGELQKKWTAAIDDVGYPMWLGIVYFIFRVDNDVFVPFLLKCILGAYCAISIYRVAKRHFGEGVARMASIFVCVNPNMIYWCGNMFKETEMVFLVCLAIDNFDRVLSSGKRYTFRALIPGLLAATALFFFRASLAIVIFLAVFAHIVMVSQRVMSMGKKMLAGILVTAVLAVSMGDRIRTQSQQLMEKAQSEDQKTNMEWRSTRQGGNEFAKYASAAVFAPLIFTIPFPTFNQANEGHLIQVQLSGGSYIKNILSFFVIIVMFMMLISGEWRRHVFIIAYTVGYLMVLVMSPFAQSGRFHMPIWPMLMLFAAYGIQIAKTNARVRKWFPIVLVIEVVACLAWNWFKLKGRGMI